MGKQESGRSTIWFAQDARRDRVAFDGSLGQLIMRHATSALTSIVCAKCLPTAHNKPVSKNANAPYSSVTTASSGSALGKRRRYFVSALL